MPRVSGQTYYEILGVERSAPSDAVVRAFRRLAVQFHPDHNQSPFAAEIFAEVTQAYRVLSNPERRAAYDNELNAQGQTQEDHSGRAAWAAQQDAERRAAGEMRERNLVAVREAKAKAAESFGKGFLWAAGGGVATWIGYSSTTGGGGYYFVFWGAIVVGAIQMLRAAYYYIRLLLIERSESGQPPVSLGRPIATAAVIALIGIYMWSGRSSNATTASAPPVANTATPTPRSTITAPQFTPQPVVTPTRVLPPTPIPTRAVLLRADQMITPPGEFPLSGYRVGEDVASGINGWFREFDAVSKDVTGYYFFEIYLRVAPSGDSGASLVAAQTCQLTDPEGRPVRATDIVAEVIGDGAKACRFDIGNAIAYDYYTAERNVLIRVRSNPWNVISNADAMRDSVRVARTQISIIQRVAPR